MIRNLTPRPAEKGRIKIGGLGEERQKRDGSGTYMLPVKYDHFEIVTMQRDAAGRFMKDTALMDRLMKVQGVQKLLEIPIRLLFDDPDLNFFTRYSAYQGTRCVCSGDGEEAQRLGKDGKFCPVSCPCERLEPSFTGQPKCKPLGSLRCLIEGVERVGGIWSFRTTSFNSINAILSSMALIRTITGGPLAGIPLMMVLSPKTVTTPDGKSMVAYIVSLEFRGPEEKLAELGYELARRRMEHRVRMEAIEEQARKLLVAPHQEPFQEQEETAAEFFPEGAAAGTEGGNGQGIAEEQVYVIPQEIRQASPEPREAITLPALMEQVKKSPEALSNLPIPLVTTKGVSIGQWIDYAPTLGGEMQVVLELVDDLEKVANELTVAMIERSFREAGINLVVAGVSEPQNSDTPSAPGLQISELPPEHNGVIQAEIGSASQESPEAPEPAPKGKKPHLQPVNGATKGATAKKSLF